jgi:hypothetical protein
LIFCTSFIYLTKQQLCVEVEHTGEHTLEVVGAEEELVGPEEELAVWGKVRWVEWAARWEARRGVVWEARWAGKWATEEACKTRCPVVVLEEACLEEEE